MNFNGKEAEQVVEEQGTGPGSGWLGQRQMVPHRYYWGTGEKILFEQLNWLGCNSCL